jgi:hypothetical protein
MSRRSHGMFFLKTMEEALLSLLAQHILDRNYKTAAHILTKEVVLINKIKLNRINLIILILILNSLIRLIAWSNKSGSKKEI